MKKSTLVVMWDMVRMRHGVGLRCVEALPADKLDAHPVKDMRTPKELVVHMYLYLRAAPESILSGTLEYDEQKELAAIRTKQDLVKFTERCWQAADAVVAKLTDAQLASMVKTPWGEMNAGVMIGSVQEEYLHHRGQLYVFLRLFGVEPPVSYDFDASAPEFRPKQHS
ncbi:MAG TPA: DinB family protein [Methylomirabilota bacterium]|jgi:uncharacterized damage-inducible protein DinB|nr:DinB family protein [Methylomirabilota bacterium]